MIRDLLDDLVVRYRRRRLLRAYGRVFEARTGKRVGFSPVMAAWSAAEADGLLTIREDGSIDWHWPDSDDGCIEEQEPTAHRLSYPDLDAGEEYAGVIEISSEDSDE